jgi:selenocysteine lyase/cysteine desulfurase
MNLRTHFPVTERYAYLNNAGVAPLCKPAADALTEFTREALEHGAARYAQIYKRTERVRASFAKLVGAGPDEVAFVANTSDGLSLVANGIDWKPGDRVLVPEHEFPANVYPWLNLEKRGVKVERIPFVDERCTPEHIAKFLPGARLLALSAVSFANGYRFDLEAIGKQCERHGVLFCVDAIQAVGAFAIDVQAARIDFLAADGHKWITGPEGAGCFYIRNEQMDLVAPSKIGWRNVRGDVHFSTIDFTFKDDAGRYEEGTPNVPGLYGMGAAMELLLATGLPAITGRIRELTDHLATELPKLGYTVRSPRGDREWSGIVSFLGDGDDLTRLAAATEAGVVMAHRAGALRASPHAYNDHADLERLLEVLAAHKPA